MRVAWVSLSRSGFHRVNLMSGHPDADTTFSDVAQEPDADLMVRPAHFITADYRLRIALPLHRWPAICALLGAMPKAVCELNRSPAMLHTDQRGFHSRLI